MPHQIEVTVVRRKGLRGGSLPPPAVGKRCDGMHLPQELAAPDSIPARRRNDVEYYPVLSAADRQATTT